MDICPSTFLVFSSSTMTCIERFSGHLIFKWPILIELRGLVIGLVTAFLIKLSYVAPLRLSYKALRELSCVAP